MGLAKMYKLPRIESVIYAGLRSRLEVIRRTINSTYAMPSIPRDDASSAADIEAGPCPIVLSECHRCMQVLATYTTPGKPRVLIDQQCSPIQIKAEMGIKRSDKEVPSEEGRFDSKGLSTCKNAKRESHDHQEIGEGYG
jgi:hypothetical protein